MCLVAVGSTTLIIISIFNLNGSMLYIVVFMQVMLYFDDKSIVRRTVGGEMHCKR